MIKAETSTTTNTGSSLNSTNSSLAALATIAAMTTPTSSSNNRAEISHNTTTIPNNPVLLRRPRQLSSVVTNNKSLDNNHNNSSLNDSIRPNPVEDMKSHSNSKLSLSYIATAVTPPPSEQTVREQSPTRGEISTSTMSTCSQVCSSTTNDHLDKVPLLNRGRKRNSRGTTLTANGDKDPWDFDLDSGEELDETMIKRMKNTEAARRSRLRKVQRMQSLEHQISELKDENSRLQTRVAVLESEKTALKEKSQEKDARIRQLEQQLSEAYGRLVVKRDGGGGAHHGHYREEEQQVKNCEKCQGSVSDTLTKVE